MPLPTAALAVMRAAAMAARLAGPRLAMMRRMRVALLRAECWAIRARCVALRRFAAARPAMAMIVRRFHRPPIYRRRLQAAMGLR